MAGFGAHTIAIASGKAGRVAAFVSVAFGETVAG